MNPEPGQDDNGFDIVLALYPENLHTATVLDDRLPGRHQSDRNYYLAGARRKRFLAHYTTNLDMDAALAEVGWTFNTYRHQRSKDKRFAAAVDAIRGSRLGRPKIGSNKVLPLHDAQAFPDHVPGTGVVVLPDGEKWDGGGWHGFVGFRKRFFGMDTPWFHKEIIDTMESAEPGSVTLILLPPEHGKTTLLEDWIGYKLAVNPDYRVIYGSEKLAHARKVAKRIKWRMDPQGPMPEYVANFGPFVPQTGDLAHAQPWNQDYFDVYHRTGSDERDYSMVCLGFGAAVAGTRTDLLVMDDPQSLKSLNHTKKMIEEFRQDWLSRPGSLGRTAILMTRVGPVDFAEALIDAGLVDNLIKYPAINAKGERLWPERYTQANYDQMRRNAGETAWARNYQQNPMAAGDRTFTDDMLNGAAETAFRFNHLPPGVEIKKAIVAHDPGYGVNAVMTLGVTAEKCYLLGWRTDRGLTSNDQMAQIIGEEIDHFAGLGVRTAHLVIEKSFGSQGLFTDDAFLALATKYGCSLSPHHTGHNKLDDGIGIAAMARAFSMGELVLPGADDDDTKRARAALDSEFAAWRPGIKGTKLRQDLVITAWMGWLRWRTERLNTTTDDRTHVFRMSGLANPTQYRPLTKIGALM